MSVLSEQQSQSLQLHDTQKLAAVSVDSQSAANQTLMCDIGGDTTDEQRGWRSAGTGSRLHAGELVPGTRFRIVRWIGEGGMGQVFEAVHADIERRIALKVLKSGLRLTPDLCATFLLEARACARIESRFVVKVLDFGVLPDDRPFFAMELLGQSNLHTILAGQPMSLERAMPILRQTCKALAAIHEAGLVHRDVKPDNLIVQVEDGRADTIRMVDFGVAVAPGSGARVAGTPMYMAPEQIRGETFDGRVDIYALGCMAFEMLTGGLPFTGTIGEVFEAQLERPIPPVSKLREDLPRALDAVLLKCVEKRPEDRWANVHELEAALCEVQILAGFTTEWDDLAMPALDERARESLAQRMPRASGAQAPSRALRWLGLAAGTLVVGLSAGVLWGEGADPAADTPTIVEAAPAPAPDTHLDTLSNQVRLAASLAYWVYPPLGDIDQPTALHWITRLEAEQGPLAERALSRAAVLREELAQTLVRLGDKYWEHTHGRSFAIEYYALALIFMPTHTRALERSAMTPAQLADLIARAQRGEFTGAELRAAEVMTVLADDDPERLRERVASLVEDDETVLSIQTRERLVETFAARPTPVEPALEPDLGSSEDEVAEAYDPRAAERQTEAALQVQARGDVVEAERLFMLALALDNRSVAALSGLAELHFDKGRYSAALGYARKAAKQQPRNGERHILVGDCYIKVLRYANARKAYEKAEALGHAQAAERLTYLDGLTD